MNREGEAGRARMDDMRYNVSQLLRAPVGTQRHHAFAIDAPRLDPLLEFAAPLEGEVIQTRTPEGVLVEVHVRTVFRAACDRCLEPVEYPIESHWSEEFHPTLDIVSGQHLPVSPDDQDQATLIDERHTLDLTESVRQHLLLARSSHPLCRDDCAGLCPECGANLNRGACACQHEELDSRWGSLARLLQDKANEAA